MEKFWFLGTRNIKVVLFQVYQEIAQPVIFPNDFLLIIHQKTLSKEKRDTKFKKIRPIF